MLFSKYEHDVFISHAVEDKLAIANELFQRLEEAGLNIWYSGKGLRIGDSIENVIRRNLSKSRYAVVIFSKNYLSKNWTMKEFYLLLGHEIAQRKVILPILLDVTVEDLKQKDIAIADKFAIPFEKGMDYIVEKILEEVKGIKQPRRQKVQPRKYSPGRRIIYSSVLAIALVILSYFTYATLILSTPDTNLITQTIEQRVSNHKAKIDAELKTIVNRLQAVPAAQKDIAETFSGFDKLKTHYRNEYDFSNGFKDSKFKKNIESDLNVNVDALTVYNSYGLENCTIFLSPKYRDGVMDCINYTLFNSNPLSHEITGSKVRDNGDYEVTVQYKNNIRGVNVTLVFPAQDFPKRYQVSWVGFLPVEKYIFHHDGDTWTWTSLE